MGVYLHDFIKENREVKVAKVKAHPVEMKFPDLTRIGEKPYERRPRRSI
jgi:hypothetical protein